MTSPDLLVCDRGTAFGYLNRGLVLPSSLLRKPREDAQRLRRGQLVLSQGPYTGPLSRLCERPVIFECGERAEAAQFDRLSSEGLWAVSGALPCSWLGRIHVPTSEDEEELRAREYRGFDAASLTVAVTPELFAGGSDALPPVDAGPGVREEQQSELERRDAVAAGLCLYASDTRHPMEPVLESLLDTGASARALAEALQAAETVDDVKALERVLRAVFRARLIGVDAPDILARARSIDGPGERAWTRQLEFIGTVLAGGAGLGDLGTHLPSPEARALLLFLVRPDPESVGTWLDEDIDSDPGVVALARLFSGLAHGVGGLPTAGRTAALDRLLAWTCEALGPLPFEPLAAATAAVPVQPPSDVRSSLVGEVDRGDHDRAIRVATVLAWPGATRVVVRATDVAVRSVGRGLEVEFPGDARVEHRLVAEEFLRRVAEADEATLSSASASSEPADRSRRPAPRRRSRSKPDLPRDASGEEGLAPDVGADAPD